MILNALNVCATARNLSIIINKISKFFYRVIFFETLGHFILIKESIEIFFLLTILAEIFIVVESPI